MRRMTDKADTLMSTEFVAITARDMEEVMILNALCNFTGEELIQVGPQNGRVTIQQFCKTVYR